ncbi:MAG: hypothetical protein ACR2NV_09480, partial [Thermoleophilaceae bacterium]
AEPVTVMGCEESFQKDSDDRCRLRTWGSHSPQRAGDCVVAQPGRAATRRTEGGRPNEQIARGFAGVLGLPSGLRRSRVGAVGHPQQAHAAEGRGHAAHELAAGGGRLVGVAESIAW